MKASALEIFLARLYTDKAALDQFLADPNKYASQSNLDETDIAALRQMDLAGLQMAAASYASKRRYRPARSRIYGTLLNWIKGL